MASKKEKTHIKDLIPDQTNRRKHNPRNIGMITDSLNAVGAWRSIAIDENDVVHAGNGVIEAAADAGITKLRVIEAEGDEIIAVRRRGLTDEQKRMAAMYDNRTSELAEWNIEQLKADAVDDLDLKPFFFEGELESLLDQAEDVNLNDFFQSDTESKSTDDGKTLTLTFRPDEYIAVIEALKNREGTNEQVLMELLGVDISAK
tara:strand:- start:3661 stop:4269 length:609 start_codon:yes stop_codon:yes gene_type:complete